MTILGCDPETYRRKLTLEKLFCAVLAAAVLALNLLLLGLADQDTACVLFWACVLTDTLAGWVILTAAGTRIVPKEKKYRLFQRSDTNGVHLTGTVTELGLHQFSAGMDCRTLTLRTDESRRVILIPTDEGIQLPGVGNTLRFTLADNIAVAWEVLS